MLDSAKRGEGDGSPAANGDGSFARAGGKSASSPKGGARGVVVADALYPREHIRMEWPTVRKVGSGLNPATRAS